MSKKWCLPLILLMLVFASGCATMPEFMDRAYEAQKTARQAGFDKEYVKAPGFELMTYQRFKKPSENIRIYIEGDGRAWETRSRLSDDPTPSDPIALGLAVVDSFDSVAYIARPGQFPAPDSAGCDPTYWSQRRFAPEVVEAFDRTIDILKKKSGAKHVELVGYSGGAAIAVLVAARRGDVTALRTVAGNLNPKALCSYHHVSRLDGSMDPLDLAQKVAHIPQRHFVGSKDRIVPSSIAESFVKKEGDTNCESITIVDGAAHRDGWRERWKELLSISLLNDLPH
ncbi:MAG: alpha/beta hydrolase [Candidatus Omnitrophica bacterium]|nr:alpha/beta hydrolase [Candidatus Omnitrophota bacterium]